MQQHKAVFALSLCRKAGALVTGFDAVKESVYQGKAALVLCAQDASEGTQARVRRFCEGLCQVLTLPCTQAQLAAVTKKNTAVLAVQNAELAKLRRYICKPSKRSRRHSAQPPLRRSAHVDRD